MNERIICRIGSSLIMPKAKPMELKTETWNYTSICCVENFAENRNKLQIQLLEKSSCNGAPPVHWHFNEKKSIHIYVFCAYFLY